MKTIGLRLGYQREFRKEDHPTRGYVTYVANAVGVTEFKEFIERDYGVKDGTIYDVIRNDEPFERDGKTFHMITIVVDGKPITVNSAFFQVSK